jgi:hypothetical protein
VHPEKESKVQGRFRANLFIGWLVLLTLHLPDAHQTWNGLAGGEPAFEGHALTIRRDRLSMAIRALVSLLPVVVRRTVVDGSGAIRDGVSGPCIPYFTDFLWLPNTKIADVVIAARIRGS